MHTPSGMQLCQAMMLCSCLDLPAIAAVINQKQWNGEHGCSVCLDPGDTSTGSSNAWYWPHHPGNTWQTHSGVMADAKQAVMQNKPVSVCSFTIIMCCIHQM